MKGHECYHCKSWVDEGQFHDCWTTTERALTEDLSEELQDAYERLRETAAGLGEQRIYASGSCIMFSRTSCYFFVRPQRKWLELAVFLGRPLKSPLVRRAEQKSKVKIAHMIRITHRDEVEAPLTDWLREAYEFEPLAKAASKTAAVSKASRPTAPRAQRKPARAKKKVQSKRNR
ncbi:MAG TPA: DUF5655 domain-containing protein [Vicinamibacterales bacterium]|nr:DUF5655 domain-containing protein [Vicinamibacterales bacterium]